MLLQRHEDVCGRSLAVLGGAACDAMSYLALGVKTTHFDGFGRRLSVVEIGSVEAVVAGVGGFARGRQNLGCCVPALACFSSDCGPCAHLDPS